MSWKKDTKSILGQRKETFRSWQSPFLQPTLKKVPFLVFDFDDFYFSEQNKANERKTVFILCLSSSNIMQSDWQWLKTEQCCTLSPFVLVEDFFSFQEFYSNRTVPGKPIKILQHNGSTSNEKDRWEGKFP